jgi:uncharacterized protein
MLTPSAHPDIGWRLALLAGMITGPLAVMAVTGQMPAVEVPVSVPMLLVGGLLVGIGVTYGSGCTSGHGVCGMARLSRRSIAATADLHADHRTDRLCHPPRSGGLRHAPSSQPISSA